MKITVYGIKANDRGVLMRPGVYKFRKDAEAKAVELAEEYRDEWLKNHPDEDDCIGIAEEHPGVIVVSSWLHGNLIRYRAVAMELH